MNKVNRCKIILLRSLLVLMSATLLCSCGIVGYGANRTYRKEPVYYTVKKGDTLAAIAKKHNVSHEQIALLNGIIDGNRIHVGDKLLVRQAYEYFVEEDGEHFAVTKTPKAKSNIYYVDGKFKWPIQGGGRLVSYFGPRQGEFHDGLDISALSGTPVYAAHDGQVIYADDELSGYGNLLILTGTGNIKTVYAHNRRLLVSKGTRVKKGDVIAEVGSTGRSSGPHLHFEVRSKDKQGRFVAVDPLPLFKKKYGKPRYRVNDNLTPILAAGDGNQS